MDLMKTLLVYMMLVLGSATEAGPAATPPPARPTSTPLSFVIVTPYTYVTAVPTAVPTPAPTPTPSPTPYTTLYVGDRGEDVRKLQRRLTELGYLNDKIDGIYGKNTKRAVERFQFYNGLTVDGTATRDTQRLLYESPSVVTAPPDITIGSTPTPTPTPLTGITVPVYYVDQNGLLLKRVDMVCYGSSVIYANASNVGAGYTLISPSMVSVVVRNGVASPASVTFRYQKASVPTEAPSTVSVPVYYMTNTGVILHQTTATLPRNAASYVSANTALVPENYQLTSAANVAVSVNYAGTASPASVIFTFRNVTPTPAPETRQVQIPVRYVNENGFLLNETTVTIAYGSTVPVYASSIQLGSTYRLVSQSPVYVSVSAYGRATPSVVIFTYSYQAPTAVPTAVPTRIPTPIPTRLPTRIPTAIPTRIPTPVPTRIPTAEPVIWPTAEPVIWPTVEPTAVPVPEPIPDPNLKRGGDTVACNGTVASIDWYRDAAGSFKISLQNLSWAMGWPYNGQGASSILGHQVEVSYAGGSVITLTVDGASYANNALVWTTCMWAAAS